jgi:predicted NAD/FAD-dependent oxidoreductase
MIAIVGAGVAGLAAARAPAAVVYPSIITGA